MSRIGIGHNNGPSLEPGFGWRKHCWSKARKDTISKHIPLEIVRLRVARAKELGLSYPQYASVLLGSGRDIVGFLFTVDGMQLRLRRALEMPDAVQEKLADLEKVDLLAFSPSGEQPDLFRAELNMNTGLAFKSAAPEPSVSSTWREAGDAVKAVLEPEKLPARSVVLIGSRDLEASWALAGGLAKFMHGESYFAAEAGR